tara:strand:+ start:579 stop:785 length:207 start_codon:yes stop_codon:yes gene_type:complete
MDTDECVQDIIVDVCKKRITLISNEGETKFVVCESGEQFLAVMEVIKKSAEPEMITYVDPATKDNQVS